MVLRELVLSSDRRIPSLTPCAGRCSTVFGDLVCRGCRRFNHEVIQWNTYSAEQRLMVWKRLDSQLDQILVPLLPSANVQQIEGFLHSKHVRVLDSATVGRKLYHALKLCEKNKHLAAHSGLGIVDTQVKPIWDQFERSVLALAKASYELAWLRADAMRSSVLRSLEDEI